MWSSFELTFLDFFSGHFRIICLTIIKMDPHFSPATFWPNLLFLFSENMKNIWNKVRAVIKHAIRQHAIPYYCYHDFRTRSFKFWSENLCGIQRVTLYLRCKIWVKYLDFNFFFNYLWELLVQLKIISFLLMSRAG